MIYPSSFGSSNGGSGGVLRIRDLLSQSLATPEYVPTWAQDVDHAARPWKLISGALCAMPTPTTTWFPGQVRKRETRS
jgi:hypothetical protein